MRGSLKRPKDEARDIAIEKLRRVGLKADVADRFPAELSGGMQKRVSLARAIAAEPEIIFFDEPTTGLDPIMSGVINDLIREIVVDMGATAMTITHDMTSVRTIADDIAMLHAGRIQWTGPVGDMDQSGDPISINSSTDAPVARSRRSDDIQFFEPSMNVLLFLMVKKFVYLEVLLILAGVKAALRIGAARALSFITIGICAAGIAAHFVVPYFQIYQQPWAGIAQFLIRTWDGMITPLLASFVFHIR